MSRSTRKRAPRRDWRLVVFMIISLMIVLTMVLAFFPTLTNP